MISPPIRCEPCSIVSRASTSSTSTTSSSATPTGPARTIATSPAWPCFSPATARIGAEPLARVVSRGVHGVDPDVFGIAPVEAANQALRRAGIGWHEVELVELDEAFASQSLACLRGRPELDPEKVNVRGGAIAIGHPLGASGARLVGRLAKELRARGGRYGVAALCIGVGQGLAIALEASGQPGRSTS